MLSKRTIGEKKALLEESYRKRSLVKKLLTMNFLTYLCYKSRAQLLYWLFNNLTENTYSYKTRG